MKEHSATNRLLIIACLYTALAASTGLGAENRLLWKIGQTDQNDAEFALAPGGYKQFKHDGVFFIGESNPKLDWPYAQPGPDRPLGRAPPAYVYNSI